LADKEEKVEDRTLKVTDKISCSGNLLKVVDKNEKMKDSPLKVVDRI